MYNSLSLVKNNCFLNSYHLEWIKEYKGLRQTNVVILKAKICLLIQFIINSLYIIFFSSKTQKLPNLQIFLRLKITLSYTYPHIHHSKSIRLSIETDLKKNQYISPCQLLTENL